MCVSDVTFAARLSLRTLGHACRGAAPLFRVPCTLLCDLKCSVLLPTQLELSSGLLVLMEELALRVETGLCRASSSRSRLTFLGLWAHGPPLLPQGLQGLLHSLSLLTFCLGQLLRLSFLTSLLLPSSSSSSSSSSSLLFSSLPALLCPPHRTVTGQISRETYFPRGLHATSCLCSARAEARQVQ